MFSQTLSYVAIVARDPAVTARRLAETFDLTASEVASGDGPVQALSVGRSCLLVLPPGHSLAGRERPGVDHIAIGVADLAAARAEASSRGLKPGASAAGLAGEETVDLSRDELLGVRAVVTSWMPPGSAPGGAVERIDHLGIASADAGEAVRVYGDRLGLPLESTQTDVETTVAVESFTSSRYGVVVHSRPARIAGGLRVAFLTVGDCDLEFLQNLDPEHGAELDAAGAGTTKQDQGAITRYVARHGPGLHHVALKTGDIDGLLERAHRASLPLIDRRGRPGSRAGRIGFFHPDAFGGVLFHLVERRDDPASD